MAPTSQQNTIRVGILIAGALAVLMVFLFFIGSESKIWARKNEYEVRFESVAGLAEGNPVKISGVTVGVIKDITLPRDPKMRDVDIMLMVDRKYADRIRTDSRARLKKLGLLAGDSYVDISPGTPRFDPLEPGSLIPPARGFCVRSPLPLPVRPLARCVQVTSCTTWRVWSLKFQVTCAVPSS